MANHAAPLREIRAREQFKLDNELHHHDAQKQRARIAALDAAIAALEAGRSGEAETLRRIDSFVTEMEACGRRYDENVRTYTRKLRHILDSRPAAPQQPPPVGDDLSRDDLAKLLIASCIDINAGFAEIRLEGMTDDGKEVGDWCVTVARVDAAQPTAEATLRRIVEEADRHPFNPIGHVIEHVAPEARALSAPPVGVTDRASRARKLLAEAERGEVNDYGSVHRRIAHAAIEAALSQQEAAPSVSEAVGAMAWRLLRHPHLRDVLTRAAEAEDGSAMGCLRRLDLILSRATPAPVSEPAASGGESLEMGEYDKVIHDAVAHGAGFMQNGKHIPREQVYAASGEGLPERLYGLHTRFLSDTSSLPDDWQDWREDYRRDLWEAVEQARRLTTTGQGDVDRG